MLVPTFKSSPAKEYLKGMGNRDRICDTLEVVLEATMKLPVFGSHLAVLPKSLDQVLFSDDIVAANDFAPGPV